MAHTCPICGQTCCCNGDYDDFLIDADEDIEMCTHCDEMEDLDLDDIDPEKKCRICGCTEFHACPGGCYWVEENLCSKCAAKMMDTTIID